MSKIGIVILIYNEWNISIDCIKSIRKKYQLTQKELADAINTSQSTISSYEKGKTLVLTVFIYNLALNFNLSVDKICDRNKELVKI